MYSYCQSCFARLDLWRLKEGVRFSVEKTAQTSLKCPECGTEKVYLNGTWANSDGIDQQRYKCPKCKKRFSLNSIGDSKAINQIRAFGVKNLVTTQNIETVCAGDSNLV